MAHTVSHEEQVDQQLAKDRQAQTRRQWTVCQKEGGEKFQSLRSKVNPNPVFSKSRIML